MEQQKKIGKTIHLTHIFENHCPWTKALEHHVSISDSFSFLFCLAARKQSCCLNTALNVFVRYWAALFDIIFSWAARNCSVFWVNVAVPGQHEIADFPLGLSYCLSQFVSFASRLCCIFVIHQQHKIILLFFGQHLILLLFFFSGYSAH